MDYVSREKYKGRTMHEPRRVDHFHNPILDVLLFGTREENLCLYGILTAASRNWKHALTLGKLPTTDNLGNEMPWATFEAFEAHVQAIYDRLSAGRKAALLRRVPRT